MRKIVHLCRSSPLVSFFSILAFLVIILFWRKWVYNFHLSSSGTHQNLKQHDSQLASNKEMLLMSHKQLANIYHKHVNNIEVRCWRILRLGNIGEGGWDVCDDKEFRPGSPCLVYSFGIGNDSSFDEAVAQRYSCEVHSFDPVLPKQFLMDSQHPVHYHKIGLGDENRQYEEKNFHTLLMIKKQLDHLQFSLDILKADIEEWEWAALREMIHSNALSDITQLLMEFHMCVDIKIEPSRTHYLNSLLVFKQLQDLGFRIFSTQKNFWCSFNSQFTKEARTCCHNVHFLKNKPPSTP